MSFPGGSVVKNPPATQEAWVWSLGQEDLMKEEMAHSSILVWEIPWAEEPGGYSPLGCKELDISERLTQQEYDPLILSGIPKRFLPECWTSIENTLITFFLHRCDTDKYFGEKITPEY